MSRAPTPLEKVEADIDAVEIKIVNADEELSAATKEKDIDYWRKEKAQLRKEKEQLREEKLLLLKKVAAPDSGKCPLLLLMQELLPYAKTRKSHMTL